MFGMIPFVKAAGRGLGALIKGRKGKETLEKELVMSKALAAWKTRLARALADANRASTQLNQAIRSQLFQKPIMAHGVSIPKSSKPINPC